MRDLPASWTLCEIGDVLQPVGKTQKNEADRLISYVDISSIDNQSNRITAPKHMSLAAAPSRARQKIRSGDVLFSTVRPYLRNIAPVGQALDGEIASTGFAVLRAAEGIEPRYLFYKSISHDFVSALTGEQHGVSYPAVKEDQVKEQQLELPPTAEQCRIVKRIEALFDEIDRGVERLRDAQRAIALYRRSLLKSAFEGRLTADWRAKNTDRLECPDVLLTRIREERKKRYRVSLEDWKRSVAEWTNCRENDRKPLKPKRPARFEFLRSSNCAPWPSVHVRALLDAPLVNGRSMKEREGGFPILRLTALQSGKIDLRESKEGDWSEDDAEPFLVKRGDMFVSRGNGSKKLVGIGGRVLDEPMPVAFPDTMIRLRLDTNAVRPEYFVLAWNSYAVRRQIEMAARTTAGIYKINQGHISGFALPLPSLAEQSEIVRILDGRIESTDALQTEVDTNIARAETLRQSILRKAFSGQLVPQDPADEPADILLQRIEAENPSRKRQESTRKRKARIA